MTTNNSRNPNLLNIPTSSASQISSFIKNPYVSGLLKICTSEVSSEKDTVIIKLNLERATLQDVSTFNDYLKTELNWNYDKYILDISESNFVDSTFLGAIIKFFKQINQKSKNLSLVVNFEKLQILAPLEQLQKILKFYSSIDEAVLKMK